MEQLQIFISYASEDRVKVRDLHQRLTAQGYKPWLDDEDLLPGQDFKLVIEGALTSSDFIIICLSQTSVAKRSFIQHEFKLALEKRREMRPDDIFVIPARLEDCEFPAELKHLHCVNLFEERGWEKLFKALEIESARRGEPKTVKSVTLPTVATPLPKPTPSAPVVKPGQLGTPTRSFDFVTARVDEHGRIIERVNAQVAGFEEDLGHGVHLQMIEIPAGTFRMGSTDAEVEAAFADAQRYRKDPKREWYEWETPRHRVAVPDFWMSRYQVTQEQWWAVARLPKVKLELPPEPSAFEGDKLPVEQVSWEEAVEFCQRLERQFKRTYRLPSEAEWEYGCRAGSTTPFAFGPTITPELVNYDGNYPYGEAAKGEYRQQTVPVGSLGMANAFGLYDMHGNVWEWCADVWHKSYQDAPIDGSAWLSGGDSSSQVLRGGSWIYDGRLCRSANRGNNAPGYRSNDHGFRVVVSSRTS
ncbi:MAG: SUMF1/EgtB/PvdO family nonheme iron enzyme [Acidobacteria bacterium]|nr:SUMF1/EgtB/PvdO family nonheme iron enzyme [Acidobacteriota bacterium]MBI3427690.1 SUMF1/EgtB/PvdO family nonheme iron enzyme [Acidobacteriota bacterium]